jgi:CRISPR/Cas system CMR subunit Cmr6 (Cas7 group RAMP superfamily)
LKQNDGETISIYTEAKRTIRKRNEAKRKQQKRKEKIRKRNEAKKKIFEAKHTKNWKRIKQKETNKFMRNFRLNMRNGSETNTVSLSFALKRNRRTLLGTYDAGLSCQATHSEC